MMNRSLNTKKEVIDFCNSYIDFLVDKRDKLDSLFLILLEFSPSDYEQLYILYSAGMKIEEVLYELVKSAENKYTRFLYKQLAYMFKTNDENPISFIEETRDSISNEFYK